jgi:hypothetical protein
LLGKRFRQTLDDLGDEFIARADGFLWIINKTSLHNIPTRAKIRRCVRRK